MKVTGVLVALAAAAPMASAIPFRLSDILSPVARAPAPVEAPQESFPQIRSSNLTARATNETTVEKRSFVPQGSEEQGKRSFHNGAGFVPRNMTFKA